MRPLQEEYRGVKKCTQTGNKGKKKKKEKKHLKRREDIGSRSTRRTLYLEILQKNGLKTE